jgi:hypothetical protein
LHPEGIALLRDHFAHLWDLALAAFQKAAEDEYKKEKQYDGRSIANRRGKANHPRKRTR